MSTETPPPGDHDRKGAFAPGNNARSKVKAKRTHGLARFLAQETRDGQEMGEVMLRIARTDGHRDQLKAAQSVLERIMGKAPDRVELTGKNGAPLSAVEALVKGMVPEDLLTLAKAKTEGT